MSHKIINKNSFNILGIGVTTTGDENQDSKDIAKLWQKFFSENISSKIPFKKNNRIINLYTDYEIDQNGPYTAILGYEVESLKEVPLGMIGKFFAGNKYTVFTSKGNIPDIINEVWKKINSTNLKRAYKADFDIYAEQTLAGYGEVETYVSIE
jgi:predicted transcriptional regulator YdeE